MSQNIVESNASFPANIRAVEETDAVIGCPANGSDPNYGPVNTALAGLANRTQYLNDKKLSKSGGTMTGDITFGHKNIIRSELVFATVDDLTLIAAGTVKNYKVTPAAASYNTIRFALPVPSPAFAEGKVGYLFLNLNGGNLGQELLIINDCAPNPSTLAESYRVILRCRCNQAPTYHQIQIEIPSNSGVTLRKLFSSTPAENSASRIYRFPHEGTSAYQWKMVGQFGDVQVTTGTYTPAP